MFHGLPSVSPIRHPCTLFVKRQHHHLKHSCSTALGNGYGLRGFAGQAPGGAPSPYGLSCPPGCLPTEERRDAQGFASRTPCACRYASVGGWPHASVGRPPRCRGGGLLLLGSLLGQRVAANSDKAPVVNRHLPSAGEIPLGIRRGRLRAARHQSRDAEPNSSNHPATLAGTTCHRRRIVPASRLTPPSAP